MMITSLKQNERTKKMNNDLKNYAKISGVKLWEIADKLGMKDSNFSKILRYEISEELENKICKIIDEVAASKREEKRNGKTD